MIPPGLTLAAQCQGAGPGSGAEVRTRAICVLDRNADTQCPCPRRHPYTQPIPNPMIHLPVSLSCAKAHSPMRISEASLRRQREESEIAWGTVLTSCLPFVSPGSPQPPFRGSESWPLSSSWSLVVLTAISPGITPQGWPLGFLFMPQSQLLT